MKTNFVSIQSIIGEWVEDSGISQDEINENRLKRWATDAVRHLSTDEQLSHRITLIPVKNYNAEVPRDFKLLAQAAAREDFLKDCEDCDTEIDGRTYSRPKRRREQISQWVQDTLDKDCELEINLVCPTCHKTSCDHSTPAVEVDVDRIWEMAHPEIYYSHFSRIGRFGDGGPASVYNPEFRLMRYASNDYFAMSSFIPDCPNVNCDDCYYSFIIDLPYIKVDFPRGEILLSYLGKKLDENGDLMIPDHPSVSEAIFWYLEHKHWWIQFRRKDSQADFRKYQEAKAQMLQAVSRARSALQNPEFKIFQNFLDNNWNKRIPDYSHDVNLNRISKDKHLIYKDYLDGKWQR